MRHHIQYAANLFKYAPWLTRKCLLRWGSLCAFATIGVLALNLALHSGAGLTDAAGERFGRDFFQFWSSAVLAAAGRPEAAYIVGPHQTVDQPLAYPPIVMLLCGPLAGLSYAHAVVLWGCLGLALFTWSLSRLVGWEMAAFAAVGTPAAFINIFLAQNGCYTSVLLVWGLTLVERCPVGSGIYLGLLCCKPQLGILLVPALIAGRHWRPLIAATATALALAAASAILFGRDTWIGFFDRLLLQRQWMESHVAAWSWMPTVFAMMRLLGANSPAAYLVQGVSAISAAIAVATLWRGSGPLGIKSAGLAVATFLATPYAWDYDMMILIFAGAWLADDGLRNGFRPWEKTTVLVLLVLPLISLISAKLLDFQIAPILMWMSLAVIMRRGLSRHSVLATAPLRGHRGELPV